MHQNCSEKYAIAFYPDIHAESCVEIIIKKNGTMMCEVHKRQCATDQVKYAKHFIRELIMFEHVIK